MSTLGEIREHLAGSAVTRAEFDMDAIRAMSTSIRSRNALPDCVTLDFREMTDSRMQALLIFLATNSPWQELRDCGTRIHDINIAGQGIKRYRALSASSIVVTLNDKVWHIVRTGSDLSVDTTTEHLITYAVANGIMTPVVARQARRRVRELTNVAVPAGDVYEDTDGYDGLDDEFPLAT